MRPKLPSICQGARSLVDYSSTRIGFPGLLAGHTGTDGYLKLTEKLLCE